LNLCPSDTYLGSTTLRGCTMGPQLVYIYRLLVWEVTPLPISDRAPFLLQYNDDPHRPSEHTSIIVAHDSTGSSTPLLEGSENGSRRNRRAACWWGWGCADRTAAARSRQTRIWVWLRIASGMPFAARLNMARPSGASFSREPAPTWAAKQPRIGCCCFCLLQFDNG